MKLNSGRTAGNCAALLIAWSQVLSPPSDIQASQSVQAPIPATTVELTISGLSRLRVGQFVQLSAVAVLSDGTRREVTHEAVWTTSDSAVATVSSGLVTGRRTGETGIRAAYQGHTALLVVSVDAAAPSPLASPGLLCGVERWSVKTLSDTDAGRVDLTRITTTTVRALNGLPVHCNGGPDRRTYPEEFQVYEIVARVRAVRAESDRDLHLVLVDPEDEAFTLVAEIGDPACQGAVSSPYLGVLSATRHAFSGLGSVVGRALRVRGVGFYDLDHGQAGRARNCIELHPVIGVERVQ